MGLLPHQRLLYRLSFVIDEGKDARFGVPVYLVYLVGPAPSRAEFAVKARFLPPASFTAVHSSLDVGVIVIENQPESRKGVVLSVLSYNSPFR